MKQLRITIRQLMGITAVVGVAVVIAKTNFTKTPRPYWSEQVIIARYTWQHWTLEVAPDIPGPYRYAGDDWTAALPVQFHAGSNARGYVTSGNQTRRFNYPGRTGVYYLVLFLENKEDRPTYMILSKNVQRDIDAENTKPEVD